MHATDQLMNWTVVQKDCIKVDAQAYSADQLDCIPQLCQDARYQQLMQLDVQMIKDILAANENDASIILKATSKAVQDVLQ